MAHRDDAARRQRPGSVAGMALQRCAKLHALHAGIAQRQQIVIGHIAWRRKPRRELRELHGRGSGPAHHRLPAAVVPPVERRAAVRQHRTHGGQAKRCALRGRDHHADAMQRRKTRQQGIDDGTRQRGQGAGATDGHTLRLPCHCIHCRGEIANERAAVGQVDVVHAGLQAGVRHGVILALERACGMHYRIGGSGRQLRGKIACVDIQATARDATGRHIRPPGRHIAGMPSRRDHLQLRRCRQRPHDACAEMPEAPNTTTRYVIVRSPSAPVAQYRRADRHQRVRLAHARWRDGATRRG